jgi:hypothetical protein
VLTDKDALKEAAMSKVGDARSKYNDAKENALSKYEGAKNGLLSKLSGSKGDLLARKENLMTAYKDKLNGAKISVWSQLESQTGLKIDELKDADLLKAAALEKATEAQKEALLHVDTLKENAKAEIKQAEDEARKKVREVEKQAEEYREKMAGKMSPHELRNAVAERIANVRGDAFTHVREVKEETAAQIKEAQDVAQLIKENAALRNAVDLLDMKEGAMSLLETDASMSWPAILSDLSSMRSDVPTGFLEIVGRKGANMYNLPAYQAAMSAANNLYLDAILEHYNVKLSDERLENAREAASLLEEQHGLLSHGKVKEISPVVEKQFEDALGNKEDILVSLLESRTSLVSRQLLSGRHGGGGVLKKAGKGIKKGTKKLKKGAKKAAKKVKKGAKKAAKGVKKAAKKVGKAVKKAAKDIYKGAKKIGKFVVKAIKKAFKYVLKHSPVHAFLHALIHCKGGVAKCLGTAFKKMGEAFMNMVTGGYYEKVMKCIKKRERQGKKNNRAHCIGESLKNLAMKALDAAAFIPGVGQIIDGARTAVEIGLLLKDQAKAKKKLKEEKKKAIEQCKKEDEEYLKQDEREIMREDAEYVESVQNNMAQELQKEKNVARKFVSKVKSGYNKLRNKLDRGAGKADLEGVANEVKAAAEAGERQGEMAILRASAAKSGVVRDSKRSLGIQAAQSQRTPQMEHKAKKHRNHKHHLKKSAAKNKMRHRMAMRKYGGGAMALLEVGHDKDYYCKCETPSESETKGKNRIVCDNNQAYWCNDDQTCGTEVTFALEDRNELCSYPTNLPKFMIYTETKCFYGTRALEEENLDVDTIEECDKACVARNDCSGATYDSNEKECMLRGGISDPPVKDCEAGMFGLTRTTKEEKLKVDVLNDLNNERKAEAEQMAEKEKTLELKEVEVMNAEVSKEERKGSEQAKKKAEQVEKVIKREEEEEKAKEKSSRAKASKDLKRYTNKMKKDLDKINYKAKKDLRSLEKKMKKQARKMGEKMGKDLEKCMKGGGVMDWADVSFL